VDNASVRGHRTRVRDGRICYRILESSKAFGTGYQTAHRVWRHCFDFHAAFGIRSLQLAIITLDMSLEAFIATWIVGLLLFARYYDVAVEQETRMIGLGLGLFSCCNLLNDLLFGMYRPI
jgi:hypothetical protein